MPAATSGTVDPIGPWRPLDSKVQAARNAAYQTPSMDYSLTVRRSLKCSAQIWRHLAAVLQTGSLPMTTPKSMHWVSRTASACPFPVAGQDCEPCQPPHPVVCLQAQPGDPGCRGAPPGHAGWPHRPQVWAASALAKPALGWGGLNPCDQALQKQLCNIITQTEPGERTARRIGPS